MIFGGVALAGLGLSAAGWGVSQMRLHAPLGAQPPSARKGGGPSAAFIIIVLVVLAGFPGMATFGFLYFLKEML
jgi:hypothetical protein